MPAHDPARSREVLERSYHDLVRGFDLCISHRLILPSLVLLYSAIDMAGWLDARDGEKSKASFTGWVDRYMEPARLGCTALDLYGARCGIVHRFSSDSELAAKGEAREVTYAWGRGRHEDLQTLLAFTGRSNVVAVQLEEVWAAFCMGFAQFLEDLDADPARAARVYARTDKFFSNVPHERLSDLVRLVRPPEPGTG